MTRTARFISIQIMGRTISNGLKHWIAFNYELDYLIAMQEIAAKQQVSITPLVPPLRNPDLFEKFVRVGGRCRCKSGMLLPLERNR